MVVANDNTHTINQRMKPYFVDFFFHLQSMSFVIMVICNLTFVIRGVLIVYVVCNSNLITNNSCKI
jgi:hypothetical protein